MKKVLLVVVALMLCASVSYASCGSCEPAKTVAKGISSVGDFVGKVVSVTVADPAKGVKEGTIKVADKMGNPVSYTVNSAATIVDASFNAITLNQLKEGSMIKVKAEKTAEGKEEAKSISVV